MHKLAWSTAVLPLSLLVILTGLFGCSQHKTEFEVQKEEKIEKLTRQEEERKRQERERELIERQKFWNEQLKRYE